MPPIEITTQPEDAGQVESVESLLVAEDGNDTVQAEVIRDFLGTVEFDEIFDDPDLREYVEVAEGFASFDDDLDSWVECDETDEGAEKVEIETFKGADLADVVDEEDFQTMFDYFLDNEHPQESISDKLRLAHFGYGNVDEDDDDQLNEKPGGFKKGAFRKLVNAGGRDQVARMLLAMLKKEVIKRADRKRNKKGKMVSVGGYKGGDYKKASGYSTGTTSAVKSWKAYVKKKAAAVAKAAKKAGKKAIKIGGKTLKVGAKLVTKKAKVSAAKKKQKKGKKGKKRISASAEGNAANLNEDDKPSGSNYDGTRAQMNPDDVNESVSMARSVLGGMKSVSLAGAESSSK